MSPLEQIQQQLRELPLDKQSEVLDFVAFLKQQVTTERQRLKERTLSQHPAFGSWRGRNVDGLDYQYTLRAEWDEHA